MKNFREIFALAREYKSSILSNFLFNVLNAFFSLFTFLSVVPFLKIILIDEERVAVMPDTPDHFSANYWWDLLSYRLDIFIQERGKVQALFMMCVIILILALLKNLVAYFSSFSIAKIRTAISRDLREKMYNKILDLPVAFFSNEKKGDLISRMTNDLMEIEFSVIGTIEALIKSPVMIAIFLSALFALNWKLTLLSLIFMPLSGLLISRIGKSLKNAAKRGKDSLGSLISIIEETLGGIRVIKVFNAEGQFRQKFDRMNDYYFRLMHRLYKREYLSSPMSEFISLIVIAVLLFVGGRTVINGEMDGKMLIGYLIVFSQVIPPVKVFSDAIFKINKGAASLDRINEILKAPVTVYDRPDAKSLQTFKEEIEFRDVRFGYYGDEVIKGINLKIKKGQTVALVGQSGGGKSTLASLMARFYDPISGDVLIDGIPLSHYKVEDVRALMGFVPQESILFNDSVRNNIALGSKGTRFEDVVHAAQVANAEEFILKLKDTYDFNVGDGGNKLSGGQKQRMSIARAIFKNPPILILDEATSALDTESEKLVQDAIFKLMENRTSLVIAHRLSTIQRADLIVVLQSGIIVEQGTHDELMSLRGSYHKLVEMQDFR